MAATEATGQSDNIVPPRLGKIVAQAVDATARPYDLTALALGAAFHNDGTDEYIYVDLHAEGNDIYFQFNSATSAVLDDTIAVAAGGTMAFANTSPMRLVAGTTFPMRIQRNVDKFLILKCKAAQTATLRMYASSQPTPSALR